MHLDLSEIVKKLLELEARVKALENGTVTNNPQPFSGGGPGPDEPKP